MATKNTRKAGLIREYLDLIIQCERHAFLEGDGWKIEIAYKPILPGHLMVYAVDGNGKKIKGGLKDQGPEILKKVFDGVIEGVGLLKDRLDPKPERIYLGCFSDSGELHFHLYPVLPYQKPYDGHALDWLSSYERRIDKIPEETDQIPECDLKKFIQHIDWALKTFQEDIQFSKNN